MYRLPAGYPSEPNGTLAVLKSRRRLGLEDLQVLAVLECWGEEFYLNLARGVEHPEARALLTRNGQEERGHAHRLLKAISLLGGGDFELPSPERNPFLQDAAAIPVSGGLLSAIERGEADGDLAYQAWADAEPNRDVAALYRQNGLEETRHGERVTQVKCLLAANAPR